MNDDTRISLKVWVPVLLGLLVLFTAAVGFGRKDQRLDDTSRDLEKVKQTYVTQEYFNIRMNEFEARWEKRLDRFEKNQDAMNTKADVLLRRRE